MDKNKRMDYMRKRFPQLEESLGDAVVPLTKRDIKETVEELDAFREFQRDQRTSKEALTSDEKPS